MGRALLKRAWDLSPVWLRGLFCRTLCLAKAGRRPAVPPGGDGPLYVCGAFRSNSGLGQGARLYAQNAIAAGRETYLIDLTGVMRMDAGMPCDEPFLSPAAAGKSGGRVVIHANPPQFQFAIAALGRDFLRSRRVVAYWAWELETFPAIWLQALPYVDEIEAPSSFVANALAQISPRPVSLHTHAWPLPKKRKSGYASAGIVRCLFVFDAGSSLERKNPMAALEAFALAFPAGGATLTFKVSHADSGSPAFRAFADACAAVPGVRVIYGDMDRQAMENLFLEHDIYLSLHRSEGFGLTILEAMNYGLHAVATGWSGNMDFMRGPLAHPVPCILEEKTFTAGPCKGLKSRWAKPDTREAAKTLTALARRLRGNAESQA